ncbi:unnamed protein product [Allacma fusca]|uniref:Carboxylesterase type B domain-containing protein n=1 Tax=Allacma fusca TaxID=39272 RepID=A0A8J2JUR2_9HEXA|nr:unnamed protein product [Allacma fusca]CAG7725668.1 unnamed protein product [Allacma fusca]
MSDITENEFLKFGPSIEYIDPDKAFLKDIPFLLLKEGRIANKVPWLGTLSFNGGFTGFTAKTAVDKSLQKKLNANIKTILPRYLDYDVTASDPDVVTQKIIDNYFDGGEITESNILQLANFVTYRFFTGPTIQTGDYYPDHAPQYVLMNSYVPSGSCTSIFGYDGVIEGACTEDVSYQFPWTMYYPGINKASKDYPVSKKLVDLYASFIEMGKSTKTWGEIQNWLTYDRIKRFGVNIDNDGGMNSLSYSPNFFKNYQIWTTLLKNELASEQQNPEQETF